METKKTKKQIEMELDWKRNVSYEYKQLHSMCSYLAMFPPYVPSYYIEKFTKEGDLVYDPFSGRGTTPLEAKRLNRKSISNDLSPLAYLLSKSKVLNLELPSLLKRVKTHKNKYKTWIKSKENKLSDTIFDDIKIFYSNENLKQIFYIREVLGKNFKSLDDIDTYILSIALGIAHGKSRADGSTLYFSVSMPNGYSMSPNYTSKYIKKNKLIKPVTDVFQQIIDRILMKVPIDNGSITHETYLNNSLNSSEFIKSSPKLIFTSPPYLNIVKYISQNWIRFWFLGFDKQDTNGKIVDDYHTLNSYKIFIKNFLEEMIKIMNEDSKLIMVIGDVNKISIREVIKEIVSEVNLKYVSKPEGQILKRKLSNQMGEKVGKATPTDWVFILEKKNE